MPEKGFFSLLSFGEVLGKPALGVEERLSQEVGVFLCEAPFSSITRRSSPGPISISGRQFVMRIAADVHATTGERTGNCRGSTVAFHGERRFWRLQKAARGSETRNFTQLGGRLFVGSKPGKMFLRPIPHIQG